MNKRLLLGSFALHSLLFGCSTSSSLSAATDEVQLPAFPTAVSSGGTGEAEASSVQRLQSMNQRCAQKLRLSRAEIGRLRDNDSRVRSILAASTAGVGAVGASIAAASNGLDAPMMTASGTVGGTSSVPTWVGVTTAVLSAAGGICTAVVAPGASRIRELEDEIGDTQRALNQLQNFLNAHSDDDAWSPEERGQFNSLVAVASAACE